MKKTKEIVKQVSNTLKVKLEDKDILTSHRISTDRKIFSCNSPLKNRNNSKHPPITDNLLCVLPTEIKEIKFS